MHSRSQAPTWERSAGSSSFPQSSKRELHNTLFKNPFFRIFHAFRGHTCFIRAMLSCKLSYHYPDSYLKKGNQINSSMPNRGVVP